MKSKLVPPVVFKLNFDSPKKKEICVDYLINNQTLSALQFPSKLSLLSVNPDS